MDLIYILFKILSLLFIIYTVIVNLLDMGGVLDVLFKLATISIAIFNAYFAWKVFKLKDNKENIEKEKDRKIYNLKTLFLDHKLKPFFEIFNNIELEFVKTKENNLTLEIRNQINNNVSELFIKMRKEFYDTLIAIDKTLYEEVQKHFDDCQDKFSKVLFDESVDLSISANYEENVDNNSIETKCKIIGTFGNYRG